MPDRTLASPPPSASDPGHQRSFSTRFFRWRWVLLALAFLPALGLAGLVRENWTDLPYSDEWHTSLGTPLALFREGALRPADLWAQHTESRPLFPRLVALALVGRSGNWDVRVGMAISLLEAAAISGLLYNLLGQGRPAPGMAARAAMLLPINGLLFTRRGGRSGSGGWKRWSSRRCSAWRSPCG